jgi:hypothetical protein
MFKAKEFAEIGEAGQDAHHPEVLLTFLRKANAHFSNILSRRSV